MAVLQLVLPNAAPMLAAGAVAGLQRGQTTQEPPPVIVPAILAHRSLFSPSSASAASAAPPDPLNGTIIAGVMQRGRMRVGVVQGANGRIRYVVPGAMVAGWRLVALAQGTARLAQGSQHLEVAYGAHATAPAPQAAQSKPEE